MQRYEKYKDSNISWIGEIPEHWEVRRLKFLFKELNERTETGKEELLSLSKYKGVIPKSELEERTGGAQTLVGYKKIFVNNLVINKMQASNGLIGVSKVSGITSPDYSVYEVADFHVLVDYYGYLLVQPNYLAEYKKVATGVMEGYIRLYTDDFFRIPALFPPLPEQRAIAEFLDQKTAQIEKAIALKQRQIALLKERRQGIIHEAVTGKGNERMKNEGMKGNEGMKNEEMKDSGVEWIGKIPKHWEVRRLKFLCDITTGGKNTEDKVENGIYPFFVRSQTPERINTYSFDGEAILTAGDGAGVGKVYHYVNGKFDFHQRVYKFSSFKSVKGLYLFHYLESNFYNVAMLGTAKSTVDSLRLPLIQDFMVCFPPLSEQSKIVAYIEGQNEKIHRAISIKEQEIEKLKEYKAVLIDSAVTGKVRVMKE